MTYLELNEAVLKKLRDKAKQEAIGNQGEEEAKDLLLFTDSEVSEELSDLEVDENEITCSQIINCKGEQLAYNSVSIPLDLDLVTTIVSIYMKKIGRLKTILEATK